MLRIGFGPGPGVTDFRAEVYDPDTGAFTPAGAMVTPRAGPTVVLLQDGAALIVGGISTQPSYHALTAAEIYHP